MTLNRDRHFVPGYDRTVPPGHFATDYSLVLTFGMKVTIAEGGSCRLRRSLAQPGACYPARSTAF